MALKARKVVVLGYPGVGKSAVTTQYVEGQVPPGYSVTVAHANYRKTVHVRGQDYDLEILDTAGQYETSNLDPVYGLGVDGYIFVFSINSHASFNTIKTINEKVLNLWGTSTVPVVLVGNKVDLDQQFRQVSPEEAREQSMKWGCPFVECSATKNLNVEVIFDKLIEQIEKSSSAGAIPSKESCVLL
uniref:Rheb n=1 Tax=Malawimonas californiana TaxID=221722 RepID=A0A2R4IKW7_MALCL|nr:Rheb [Malawimonas californiana]